MYAAADQMEDEVGEDSQIYHQQSNSKPGDFMGELKYLKRQEGCGDDGGEVFGPDFLKHEADALEHSEGGVAEEEKADLAEAMVIEELSFLEDDADQAAFGVHSQAESQMGEELVEVATHEAKDTHGDTDEERRLQELVNGDQFKPAIPLLASSSLRHLRFSSSIEPMARFTPARTVPAIDPDWTDLYSGRMPLR
jgi:hypothetical protein